MIDWNFLSAAAIVFLSFTCQMQLLPIYSELVNPSYARIKKVVVRSYIVDLIFYLTFATAGYFSTFNFTNQIAIAREPLPGFKPDYPMLVAAGAVFLVVFAAYPSNFNPWRNQFFLVVMGKTEYSQKANYLLTFGFVTTTVVISILVPNITQVLSIMGGLCAASLSYTIPCYCWLKLSEHPWYSGYNLITLICFSVLTAIGYASVIITIYELVMGVNIVGDRPDVLGT